MFADFLAFLRDYGVIGLAIAVIIGTAAKDLVNAVVDDIIMPVVALALPGGDWRTATATVGAVEFKIGHLTGALIDFLVVAFLVYGFYRYALGRQSVEKV